MITGYTGIVGVMGAPVEHSRSPQMHNAALAKAGLDYVYVPFHVHPGDIASALEGFKALNVVGINVTLPHKEAVLPYLTSISREAALIGAVNTLSFRDGEIHGDNTDAEGFLRALQETEGDDFLSWREAKQDFQDSQDLQDLEGESRKRQRRFRITQRDVPALTTLSERLANNKEANNRNGLFREVVVLGAGGAARAVVVALALAGAKRILIANRTTTKAVALAEEMQQKTNVTMHGMGLTDARVDEAVRNSTLLVNTATASMDAAAPLLIDNTVLSPHTFVYDIVYTPPVTPLMHAAAARGCKTLGGIGMLIHQGAIAFEKWTGIKPCLATLKGALS